jgi:hypothetical protein
MTPKLYVWPVPRETGRYELRFQRAKMLQDISANFSQTANVPGRWLDALVAGLAAKLAMKYKPERYGDLKQMADLAYNIAAREDRERVPLRLYPDMMNWTVN